MKWRKGPRPWSIRLFALAFCAVAVIGLYLAITNPVLTWFLWAKRFPGFVFSDDGAQIASYSMFTIALIPVLWIYVLRAARARWVVLVFGICKIGLWVQGFGLVSYPGTGAILRLFEPVLICVALAALFTPASVEWLMRGKELRSETFA